VKLRVAFKGLSMHVHRTDKRSERLTARRTRASHQPSFEELVLSFRKLGALPARDHSAMPQGDVKLVSLVPLKSSTAGMFTYLARS
jgi:hypothetical protein